MKRDSKKQNEDQNLCAICMKRKVSADIDCCNHQFCSTCIKDWVKGESKSCPLCRRDVNVILSIKTGGTLYNVRREKDHAPVFQREQENGDSSMFDSSSYISDSGESEQEGQSSVMQGILNYIGYGYSLVSGQQEHESQYSQEQSQQKLPQRGRKPIKNQQKNAPKKSNKRVTQQQKPIKNSARQQKKQQKEQRKPSHKHPSSAFHKRLRKQLLDNSISKEKPVRQKKETSLKKQKTSKKQSLSKSKNMNEIIVQNEDLQKIQYKRQYIQDVIDKYTKLQEQRISARKKTEKSKQIQRKEQKQKVQIKKNQQKPQQVKKQVKEQVKRISQNKQQDKKYQFFSYKDYQLMQQNQLRDIISKRQQQYRQQKLKKEKDQYQRRNKIRQLEIKQRQQRQRQEDLRAQWRAYNLEKARKEQSFRKDYEKQNKQKNKDQESGICSCIIKCLCLCCCLAILKK